MKQIQAWRMKETSKPMEVEQYSIPPLSEEDVFVRVVGCGVCHTDLGFFYDGVRTQKSLPLTLGHEISGIVEEVGEKSKAWLNQAVIIPAVLPCGTCELCKKGRGTICRQQKMPGNHIDGGFSSHIVVPSRYLCKVEVSNEKSVFGNSGLRLAELSVVADAVTTPYQSVKNSGLSQGEIAIFIGVGGIGGFGVQIAKAFGGVVVAIDINDRKLESLSRFGADLRLNALKLDKKQIRSAIQKFGSEVNASPFEWKIFETSGTKAGQELAFSLLTFGSVLNIVGFTMDLLELRLSNLMAFDAKAIGNWGCHPQYYPEVLELIRQGKIQLSPFIKTFPMSEINSVFERSHRRELEQRPILVPDFSP
ncbi:MAG: 6-hydroxycyclohex-1-ene-1-carbonyl-CoA dehydrogenase [Planctomycetota bacterium]